MQMVQIASRHMHRFSIWMAHFLLVFLFRIFLLSVLSSQCMNGWQSKIQSLTLLLKIQMFFQGGNVILRVSVLGSALKKPLNAKRAHTE